MSEAGAAPYSDADATGYAPARVTPYLTFAMLAALIVIFAAEIVFGIGPWTKVLEPELATRVAFGGLQYPLVVDREQWYRLFSAPLLHANVSTSLPTPSRW